MIKGIHVRKMLGVLVATSMLLSSFVVNAEDVTYGSTTSNGRVTVNFQLEDTYTIVMPAQIDLVYDENTGDFNGSYTIQCKASLLDGETISVKPDSYAPVFRWGNGSGGNAQQLIINSVLEQPIDTWTRNPQESNEVRSSSTDFVSTTGTITVPRANYYGKGKEVGGYYTILNFTFTKTSANP